MEAYMGIIEEIKSLATQIGTDVKALRGEKVDKEDFNRVVKALEEIANGLHGTLGEEDGGHEGAHEGGHENANTNKSHALNGYAEKIIKLLKDNHIPYLNSEEDNIEKFKKLVAEKFKLWDLNSMSDEINLHINNDSYELLPRKLEYTVFKCEFTNKNNEKESRNIDWSAGGSDEIKNPIGKFSYYYNDLYGAKIKSGERYLEFLEKQISDDFLDNYTVTEDVNQEGSMNTFYYTGIEDNNNYDIVDLRFSDILTNPYSSLLARKAKRTHPDKFNNSLYVDNRGQVSFRMSGEIKILIVSSEQYFGGWNFKQKEGQEYLAKKPKYLISERNLLSYSVFSLLSGYGLPLENKYDSDRQSEFWEGIEKKYEQYGVLIYKWNDEKGKYLIVDSKPIEDWLKEHPIDTL